MPTNPVVQSNKLDSATTKLVDFHRRKITNASPATDLHDYVILAQLKADIDPLQKQLANLVINQGGNVNIVSTSGEYDVAVDIEGTPAGGTVELFRFTFTEGVDFQANWGGSKGSVQTNPTNAQTWTIKKNGSSVGTVTISTGGVVGFTSSGGTTISFIANDVMELIGAASGDATLANVSVVFAGLRTVTHPTEIKVVTAIWVQTLIPNSQIVGLYTFTSPVTFAANWSGSYGSCGVNPTSSATFTVYKNGTSVGTVVVSTGGVFTFSTTSGGTVLYNTGDIFKVVAPSSQDATLTNIAISFSAAENGSVQLGGDLGNTASNPKVIGINGYSIAIADDSGSANAYAVTPPYTYTRTKYAHIVFKAANANTGASTLNDGGGAVAIKKGGSSALATGDISAGQIVDCYFDGTNWQMVSWSGASGSGSSGGSLVLLGTYNASSSTEIDAVTRNASGQSGAIFQTDYDQYKIEIMGLTFSTGIIPEIQFSTNGGTSYDTGANYAWTEFVHYTTTGTSASNSASAIQLKDTADGLATDGSFNVSGTLSNVNSTSLYKTWHSDSDELHASVGIVARNVAGVYKSLTAVNAFRLLASAGNFPVGSVRVYGLTH